MDVLEKGGQIERERGVYYIQLGISLPSNSFPAGRRPLRRLVQLVAISATPSTIPPLIHLLLLPAPPKVSPKKCHQKCQPYLPLYPFPMALLSFDIFKSVTTKKLKVSPTLWSIKTLKPFLFPFLYCQQDTLCSCITGLHIDTHCEPK